MGGRHETKTIKKNQPGLNKTV